MLCAMQDPRALARSETNLTSRNVPSGPKETVENERGFALFRTSSVSVAALANQEFDVLVVFAEERKLVIRGQSTQQPQLRWPKTGLDPA